MRIIRCDVCGKEYSDDMKMVGISSTLSIDVNIPGTKSWSTGWGKFEVCPKEECINKGMTRHTQERIARMSENLPNILEALGVADGAMGNENSKGS